MKRIETANHSGGAAAKIRIVWRLAWGSIRASGKRAAVTVLGMSLAAAMLSLVVTLCSALAADFRRSGMSDEDIRNFDTAFDCFTFFAVVMGCVMIYSALSICFSGRTKTIGLITSVGASPLGKCSVVLVESLAYGTAALLIGIPAGALLAELFYDAGMLIVNAPAVAASDGVADAVGVFSPALSAFVKSAVYGLLAVAAAAVPPMRRAAKLSVMDMIAGRTKINISLRPGIVSAASERLFGWIGKLAGQNYENNKGTYRGISFSLSGGTTLFYLFYCIFMYGFRTSLDDEFGRHPDVRPATVPDMLFGFRLDGEYGAVYGTYELTVFFLTMTLAILFVVISLVCASSGAAVSMDKRRGEFATLKSIGIYDSQLCLMMCVESIYLSFYSAFYGLIGAVAADFAVHSLTVLFGNMFKFFFPIAPYLLFVLLDILVGLIFAVYSVLRVRRINIIETIRGA